MKLLNLVSQLFKITRYIYCCSVLQLLMTFFTTWHSINSRIKLARSRTNLVHMEPVWRTTSTSTVVLVQKVKLILGGQSTLVLRR